MENKFDLVILGAGPGGYVAAIRGAQLGLKTAVVEKEHLGGICLNWGCIPTKALLKASEIYHTMQNAEEFGISCENIRFDFAKVIQRSRNVAAKLSGGIKHLLSKNKVAVIEGHARLEGNGAISIDGKKQVTAKNIIVATGARPRILKGIEADGDLILDYKSAMIPKTLPKKLLVIGSGAIGIEFASFYNMMGSDVTVVEIGNRILSAEDTEISQMAHKAFEKRGIKILTSSSTKKVKKGKVSVEVEIEQSGKISKHTFDKVISAVGIVPNIEEIGIEKTKIKLDKGFIKTDEYMQTDEQGVYAIGDVTAAPWLAHKASHEGIICVEKIAKQKHITPLKKDNIPGCTYCYPQVASIGLTEEQAKKEGRKIKVGRFPLMGNGKAIAVGEADGLVKTIFDTQTGELLGAHMIGAEVTEMIQGFAIAKAGELTEEEIMHTVFPHPTISESMHESVLDSVNRVIHI